MKFLLDTHTLLWWFTDDRRLSARARKAISEERNEIFVSAASAWEVATRQRLGRLTDVPEVAERFAELMTADGFIHLPITYVHCLRAGGFDVAHRDPFDRMLAAQGESESLILVTRDPVFKDFGCKVLW